MENQHETNQTYRTGSTQPPKSRRGLIAFLLAAVIFLCGISTAMGLMNIRLFRLLNPPQTEQTDALSFAQGGSTADLPVEAPEEFEVLGISGQTVEPFLQQYLHLPGGVYITQVSDAAADAGLRPGDILTAFQAANVQSLQQLQAALDAALPGETVRLTLYREGKTHILDITLGGR